MQANAQPLVIGLLGGIGSGKSTVAGILEELGCLVSDADAIVRDLLARPEIQETLKGWWGPEVIGSDSDYALGVTTGRQRIPRDGPNRQICLRARCTYHRMRRLRGIFGVKMVKVRGHARILGNEVADRVADRGKTTSGECTSWAQECARRLAVAGTGAWDEAEAAGALEGADDEGDVRNRSPAPTHPAGSRVGVG